MKPAKHAIVSFSISAILWYVTKSIYSGLLCFASGVLVDLDHFIEHTIHHGITHVSIKNVYMACEHTCRQQGDYRYKRLYLIFHIAEMAIILWILAFVTGNIYTLAIAVGYSSHLALDMISNPLRLQSYFITYRLVKRFETDALFKKGSYKNGDF